MCAAQLPLQVPAALSVAPCQHHSLHCTATLASQVVGICKARVKLEPLEVLGEEGRGIGAALRQLQKIQVRLRSAVLALRPCMQLRACSSTHRASS